jgi:hypothetical protein|tara:strand:- start:701 stop:904 length:204 start_codon:yes stop_codon:yes gene_type:complete
MKVGDLVRIKKHIGNTIAERYLFGKTGIITKVGKRTSIYEHPSVNVYFYDGREWLIDKDALEVISGS